MTRPALRCIQITEIGVWRVRNTSVFLPAALREGGGPFSHPPLSSCPCGQVWAPLIDPLALLSIRDAQKATLSDGADNTCHTELCFLDIMSHVDKQKGQSLP